MKKITLLIPFFIFIGCAIKDKNNSFQVIDYLKVKTTLDSINALPEKDWNASWRNEAIFFDSLGKKQILFIGCSHNASDSAHPQYVYMQEFFAKSKPQLAINEGGNWGLKGKIKTVKEAIKNRAGEVALLQYLSDKEGIEMENGDMPESQEYQLLFKNNNFDHTYLLFALERFVNLFKYGVYPDFTIEKAFEEKFIKKQLLKYGIELTEEQKHFDFFKKVYQNYFKKPFDINNNEPIDNFYLEDKSSLGEIHRRSKVLRDNYLLAKIDSALYKYDRVVIAFGASHIIAVKPALKQILQKHN